LEGYWQIGAANGANWTVVVAFDTVEGVLMVE
jgi:hypothetical protein